MSATATTLSPEDNRELLDAAAAAFDASREESKRGVTQAKRDIAIALAGADVLIAVRDGRPFAEPGPSGGVLIAFTDDEAASAWAATPAPRGASIRAGLERRPRRRRTGPQALAGAARGRGLELDRAQPCRPARLGRL